jgi:AmmeMemoRadiSam system protein A
MPEGDAAMAEDTGSEKNQNQTLSSGDAKPLSLEDKRTLMDIARTTVGHVVKGERVPHFEVTSPDLLEDRGAFVTLHKHGQLRGCIGYIIGVKPLYQTVQEVAEAAATRDPRFPSVTPEELPDLDYEISALSVPRTITDVKEIQVGVHGIIMRRGYHQGLLLPQVATEYGWDSKTFLEHTCMKAGLPTDAWQDEDTEIQIFSAEVFDEEQIK